MASPSRSTVRVDAQGRLVIPQHLREDLVETPGEVIVEQTDDGLLLRSTRRPSAVRIADDGLPVLQLDRPVTNDEVLSAIDRERLDL